MCLCGTNITNAFTAGQFKKDPTVLFQRALELGLSKTSIEKII